MRLGPYEVLELIGKGGMGTVARARGPDGRVVAIKLVQVAGSSTDALRMARFDRERRLGAKLGETEGFVPLLDEGEAPQGAWFVMPLLTGGTLRDRLEKGPLAVEETIEIGAAIASALGRAHALGIVHRDVKPENVLFSATGRVLVSDLGLAKHFTRDALGASKSLSLTQAGAICGTIWYMAPEQLDDAKKAGPRSDVFALGAILYECLAGTPAYPGETPLEVATRLSSGQREPLTALRQDVPSWLIEVIEQSLSLDPRARFADGTAFANALLAGPPRRRSRALLFLIAPVLAVPLTVAWVMRTPTPPPPPPRVDAAPPRPRPVEPPPLPEFVKPLLGSRQWSVAAVFGTQDRKHGAMVTTVDYHPDGKLGLSASLDGSAVVWDLATGREVRAFLHEKPVHVARYFDGGKKVATAGVSKLLEIWDASTGQKLSSFPIESDMVFSMAFVGDRVFLSESAGRVEVVSLSTGERRIFAKHAKSVYGVSVSPDQLRLITACEDGSARVFDIVTGEVLLELRHPAQVACARWSPDGRTIATGCYDLLGRLWDATTGQEIRAFRGHGRADGQDGRLNAQCFTPDGRKLVTASFDETLRVWDVATGACERVLSGHWSWAVGCAVSPDGKRVLSCGNDQTVRQWDLATGEEVLPIRGHTGKIISCAVSADGKRVLSTSLEGTVRLSEGAEELWAQRLGAIASVEFMADRTMLLTGRDGTRVLAATSVEKGVLGERGTYAAVSGKIVFAGTFDGRAQAWNVGTGQQLLDEQSDDAWIGAVALSKDGKVGLTGDAKGALRVADLGTKSVGPPQQVLQKAIVGLAIRGDGTCVIVGGDGVLRTWDFRRGVELTSVQLEDTVNANLSPAGDLVLAIHANGDATLREVPSAREVERFPISKLRDRAQGGRFSADGKWLVIGLGRGAVLELGKR